MNVDQTNCKKRHFKNENGNANDDLFNSHIHILQCISESVQFGEKLFEDTNNLL